MLGGGLRGADALHVANELLHARGGLHGLVRSTAADLALIQPGSGDAKAGAIARRTGTRRRTLTCAPGAACNYARRAMRQPT